ncbi:MAG: hypothetical protein ACLTXL_14300 [Clostridia bacterium]
MERSIKQTIFYKPPSEQLKRVAGYARVSSGKDAMLHSLSAQVSYSEFIQKHRAGLMLAFTPTKRNRNKG